MKRTNFRQQLRRTIADFSHGRLPVYTIDTFPTDEGCLGIKLESKCRIGFTKEYTKHTPNIYWFCKHLEDAGWLVKECFTGEPPKTEEKPKQIVPSTNNVTWTLNYTYYNCNLQHGNSNVYIVVRKIDDSDITKKA